MMKKLLLCLFVPASLWGSAAPKLVEFKPLTPAELKVVQENLNLLSADEQTKFLNQAIKSVQNTLASMANALDMAKILPGEITTDPSKRLMALWHLEQAANLLVTTDTTNPSRMSLGYALNPKTMRNEPFSFRTLYDVIKAKQAAAVSPTSSPATAASETTAAVPPLTLPPSPATKPKSISKGK